MKISVIIPAYNHERYIREAINSVLDQSFQDFEIIIVNDGSTDSTEEQILSVQDPRIQYISQKNCGAHAAINRGIAIARGEYISILNSDDVYLPKRLETCLHFLEDNPDYTVVMTTVEGIYSDGTPVRESVTHEGKAWLDWYAGALPLFSDDRFYPNAFAENILITTSNLFARRKCFQECGGFKALRYAHDWDMLLRLSKRYQIHLIKEDLLKYRMHSKNTVHEEASFLKVQFEVNWLIAENLRELNVDDNFHEIMGLLNDNQSLSFGALSLLLLVRELPVFYRLTDFSNPRTTRLLQMLQLGMNRINVRALQAQVEDLRAQVNDLQTGNSWLSSQREAWEEAAAALKATVQDLQCHVQDLEVGKAWLSSQCEAWERAASELQSHIQDLQAGKTWLTGQCAAWEKVAAEQKETIAALSSDLRDTTARLQKIQSHLLIRILNRLSGRKLF